MSTYNNNKLVIDINTEDSAVKLSRFSVKEPYPNFKCSECDYVNNTHKGLIMHKRMKNRISQVDGINDSDEEKSEKSINAVTVTNKISVKEKNTAKKFYMI